MSYLHAGKVYAATDFNNDIDDGALFENKIKSKPHPVPDIIHGTHEIRDSRASPTFENKARLHIIPINESKGKGIAIFKEAPIIPIVTSARKISSSTPNGFPHAGVTIQALRRFADIVAGYDPSMTSKQVVDEFVKPWTRKDSCSLTGLLTSHHNHVEHPQLKLTSSHSTGTSANVFICHAWSEVFLDLVGAIEAFHGDALRKQSTEGVTSDIDESSLCYWVDIFSLSQWDHPSSSPEWIPHVLPSGIQEIGHTCLVLSSSNNPLPLSRTWCLWEIYCSKTANAHVTIQLTKHAQSLFIKSFLNDYETIVKRFTNVELANSDTTIPADRNNIFDAIRNSSNQSRPVTPLEESFNTNNDSSLLKVNQSINEVFRDWIRKAVDDEIQGDDHASTGRGAATQSAVKLLVFAARLASDQGRYEDAEPLYRRALKSCEILFGDKHANTLTCLNNLAVLLKSMGKLKEAEVFYRRALEGHEQTLGLTSPDSLSCMNNLALLLQDMDKVVEAERLHRRALAGCEELCGLNHADTLMSVNNLAALLQTSGKIEEAEAMYYRALTGFRDLLGPSHPGTLTALSNLAYLYRCQDQLDKAEPLYRDILEGCESSFPSTHVRVLTAVNNLALLLQDRRKFEEAEVLCRRAAHGYANSLGPRHEHSLTSLNNLAYVLHSQGKLAEAEVMYQMVLEGFELTLGFSHAHTLTATSNLSLLMAEVGKLDEAESMCTRSAIGRDKTLGPLHTDTLTSLHNLGMIFRNRNKLEEAERTLKKTMTGRVKALGANHADALNTTHVLATVLKRRGKYPEAERMYRRAIEGREVSLGMNHSSTLQSVNNLAVLLRCLDRLEEAEPLLRRVLEASEMSLGPLHKDTLSAQLNFAMLLKSIGKAEEALSLYEKTLRGREKVLGYDHPDTLTAMNNLAAVYKSLDRLDEAETLYRRALAGRERTLGKDHLSTICSVNNLAMLLLAKHSFLVSGDGDNVRADEAITAHNSSLDHHLGNVVGSVNGMKGKLRSFANLSEVEGLLRRALEGRAALLGVGHRDTADSAFNLGNLLELKMDWGGAAASYSTAYDGYVVLLGADHEETSYALLKCEACRMNKYKLII